MVGVSIFCPDEQLAVEHSLHIFSFSAAFLQTEPPSLMPVPRVVLPADSVSPNLTLSCTVTGGGRFSWQWTGPGQQSEMILSDVTRTSTVTFTQVNLGDGPVNYNCQASYDPAIPNIATQNITVELDSLPSL